MGVQDPNGDLGSGPGTTARPYATGKDKAEHAVPQEPACILVVDDLPGNLLVYRTVLEGLDFTIVTARSGKEALRAVLDQEFAVILMDVNMPELDGFETATLIRKRKRSSATPIIFLTAFKDEMRMTQGYASGAVDYISTPIVPEILRAKVGVFVELFRMRRLSAQQAEEQAKRASAEEAAKRSAFLAEAGAALNRTADLDALVHQLALAPVNFLADACVLHITGPHGPEAQFISTWRTATAHASDEGHAVIASSHCPVPGLHVDLERTGRMGSPLLLEHLPAMDHAEAEMPDLQGGQAFLLPVQARQAEPCVLALLRTRKRPPFTEDELILAKEFVSRAAISMERTLLLHSIQEADRRKDEFLGMLAHELRNPLAPLRNAVTIIEMISGDGNDPDLGRACEVIDRQVTHMSRLVDDLLDATRIAHGKVLLRKSPCDLATIVEETGMDYRSIFERDRFHFEVSLPSAPCPVHGDPTRLAQVVGNLLHNAHKFTDAGGSVAMRLRQLDKDWAEIVVQDDGIGIGAGMLPRVFEIFEQADQGLERSRGGLGLGLTLVKGLVELHGGTVQASSAGTRKGTTFTVRLPLQSGPLSVIAEEAPAEICSAKHHILVIDDNHDAAESIRQLLQLEGHQVSMAFSGPTGLEQAIALGPDVIICDIGLPGMDGYEVAFNIRKSDLREQPFLIALTGYGRGVDQERARQAGFSLHFTKPINFLELRKVLAGLKPVA